MAKNKKEKKKRLKMLVLLLFLTIIMLSTSTYAWFTANRSVSIEPINVHVAASSGLQISTNAVDWKTIISNGDITTGYTNHKNMLPYELAPVSTNGAATSGYMNFYKGTVEGAAALGGQMGLTAVATPTEAQYVRTGDPAAYPSGTAPDFVAFDVFLRVDNAAGEDIYLDKGSGVAFTPTSVNASSTGDKGLQYAARYAFLQEGHQAATGEAATIQAAHGGTSGIIIEPNFDGHKATGITAAQQYYNQLTTQTVADTASGVAAVPYWGVVAPISTAILLRNTNPGGGGSAASPFGEITDLRKTNGVYGVADSADSALVSYTGSTADNYSNHLHKLFHVDQGVTKFRVYMWVEGQDVDCENNASGAYLTYTINLTLGPQNS